MGLFWDGPGSKNTDWKHIIREDHSVKELRTFLHNRGIRLSAKMRKEQLIERLQQADTEYRFRFLDLPSELRNKVYRMAFHDHTNLGRRIQGARALCRVSRQIRSETYGLFLSMGCFELRIKSSQNGSVSTLLDAHASWLKRLSTTAAAQIRCIRFIVEGDGSYHQNVDSGRWVRVARLRLNYEYDTGNVRRIAGFDLEVTHRANPLYHCEDLRALAAPEMDRIVGEIKVRPGGGILTPSDIEQLAGVFCGRHWTKSWGELGGSVG